MYHQTHGKDKRSLLLREVSPAKHRSHHPFITNGPKSLPASLFTVITPSSCQSRQKADPVDPIFSAYFPLPLPAYLMCALVVSPEETAVAFSCCRTVSLPSITSSSFALGVDDVSAVTGSPPPVRTSPCESATEADRPFDQLILHSGNDRLPGIVAESLSKDLSRTRTED